MLRSCMSVHRSEAWTFRVLVQDWLALNFSGDAEVTNMLVSVSVCNLASKGHLCQVLASQRYKFHTPSCCE